MKLPGNVVANLWKRGISSRDCRRQSAATRLMKYASNSSPRPKLCPRISGSSRAPFGYWPVPQLCVVKQPFQKGSKTATVARQAGKGKYPACAGAGSPEHTPPDHTRRMAVELHRPRESDRQRPYSHNHRVLTGRRWQAGVLRRRRRLEALADRSHEWHRRCPTRKGLCPTCCRPGGHVRTVPCRGQKARQSCCFRV
jgi:hypothetical protein